MNRRERYFFQLTEQNITLSRNFIGNDDNRCQIAKPFSSRLQKVLWGFGFTLIVGLVGVSQFEFRSSEIVIHTQISTKENTKITQSLPLISTIPTLYLGAKHQFLQNISLRMADLIGLEAEEDDVFDNSTMVVMDKVIFIPKTISTKKQII